MNDRTTLAFGFGFAVAAVFNGLLVVVKELLPGVLEWMNALTGHHWATHSIAVMAVGLVSGGAFLMVKLSASAPTLTFSIVASTIFSAGLIAAFFLIT